MSTLFKVIELSVNAIKIRFFNKMTINIETIFLFAKCKTFFLSCLWRRSTPEFPGLACFRLIKNLRLRD